MTERAITDDGDAVRLAPRHDRMLDGAFAEVVEHLVAGDPAWPRGRQGLVEVGHVEVADAPGEDLAVANQLLEAGEGLSQRMAPAPVQQIAIQPVGPQAGERAFAGGDHPGPRGVVRQHLRHQEKLVPPARDRLADDQLGVTVHFRRVDVGHAVLDAAAQGRDRRGAIAFVDIPGPLADDRDLARTACEPAPMHGPS